MKNSITGRRKYRQRKSVSEFTNKRGKTIVMRVNSHIKGSDSTYRDEQEQKVMCSGASGRGWGRHAVSVSMKILVEDRFNTAPEFKRQKTAAKWRKVD